MLSGRASLLPAISKAVPWSGLVRGNGRPERDVHARVKGMELERDQTLIVIHAQDGVEFTLDGAMKDGIGRNRSVESGAVLPRCRAIARRREQ